MNRQPWLVPEPRQPKPPKPAKPKPPKPPKPPKTLEREARLKKLRETRRQLRKEEEEERPKRLHPAKKTRQRYEGPRPTACEFCGWSYAVLDPHRMLPVSAGGSAYDPANILWLCPNDHRLIHQRFKLAGSGGTRTWTGPTTRVDTLAALDQAQNLGSLSPP